MGLLLAASATAPAALAEDDEPAVDLPPEEQIEIADVVPPPAAALVTDPVEVDGPPGATFRLRPSTATSARGSRWPAVPA
jgi:hypothetical protein